MMSTFVPKLAICACTESRAPCPTASIAITAATPMMMPSIVRNERNLFLPSERKAIFSVFDIFMLLLPPQPQEVSAILPADQAGFERQPLYLFFHRGIRHYTLRIGRCHVHASRAQPLCPDHSISGISPSLRCLCAYRDCPSAHPP